jgi:hypothetical protein
VSRTRRGAQRCVRGTLMFVMTGLVPVIHALAFPTKKIRRGCAGHRRAEATPFFERLCPRMTTLRQSPSNMPLSLRGAHATKQSRVATTGLDRFAGARDDSVLSCPGRRAARPRRCEASSGVLHRRAGTRATRVDPGSAAHHAAWRAAQHPGNAPRGAHDDAVVVELRHCEERKRRSNPVFPR